MKTLLLKIQKKRIFLPATISNKNDEEADNMDDGIDTAIKLIYQSTLYYFICMLILLKPNKLLNNNKKFVEDFFCCQLIVFLLLCLARGSYS